MRRTTLLLLLALFPPAALAQLGGNSKWGQFDFDYDDKEKPWAEIQAQLPPLPKTESLLPFKVAESDSDFFVDADSLSVGEDGVVRYTVVVRSPAGAANVLFEGMRCATKQRKTYAFGRNDGTWARARTASWEDINQIERYRYHLILYDYYFCPADVIVRNAKEAVAALRRGVNPRARSMRGGPLDIN